MRCMICCMCILNEWKNDLSRGCILNALRTGWQTKAFAISATKLSMKGTACFSMNSSGVIISRSLCCPLQRSVSGKQKQIMFGSVLDLGF